jgi:tetratricopeptide (TPR) repeat protein
MSEHVYSGAMMPEHLRPMSVLRPVLLAVLSLCSGLATAAGKSEAELLTAAERALKDGDCRVATENYVAAAKASNQSELAQRAVQLALGCNQLGAARTAAARWRALDKYSGDAAMAAALVALKRYDLAEARTTLAAWRDSGVGGNQEPLAFAQLLQQETDATAAYRVFGEVLVNNDSNAQAHLAHAQLAFAAQNMTVAAAAARRALAIDGELVQARVLNLQAMSVLGEHDAAIAGAQALDAAKLRGEDVFLLADLLAAAERTQEARDELQRLAAQPATRSGAVRRQVSILMRNGELDAAEKMLSALATDRDSTTLAIYYYSMLAERRGDEQRAMQAYEALADTPMGLNARASAARLMLKNGQRKAAMSLLEDYGEQNPDAAMDVGATRAHLLVEAGDVDAAIKELDAMDQRYPEHPDLMYQRATVLEAGGRTKPALAQLERALKLRPDDPQLQNALGFTLADHKQDLPRAETLVRASLAVSPDSPAIMDSLGWVLFQRGKFKDALPVLARAWQNSGDAEIGSHYGEVLWQSGDQAQARYVWQQALNANPAHEHLLATMKRMTGEDAAAH